MDKPRVSALIARAIVHLHFQEPDLATKVLFDALTECNFYTPTFDALHSSKKSLTGETTNGNATAA